MVVYKYWPQHLLRAFPADGTGRCQCTLQHGSDGVLSCSDKAMDMLPTPPAWKYHSAASFTDAVGLSCRPRAGTEGQL